MTTMVDLRLRLDGAVYDVRVDDDGKVHGAAPAVALARSGVGRDVLATPTGPKVTVRDGDLPSIVAWLCSAADVISVSGDVPHLEGAMRPGMVS